MDRSWSFSLRPAHQGEAGLRAFHRLVIPQREVIDGWISALDRMVGTNESVFVCGRFRGHKPPTAGTGRVLLVAVTKPLLCNPLGVKSQAGGPYKAWQRQGAGGWGQSAATQLWAEPTHPSSIWALLISVAARPPLPPGRRTMGASFGTAFCRRVPFQAKS